MTGVPTTSTRPAYRRFLKLYLRPTLLFQAAYQNTDPIFLAYETLSIVLDIGFSVPNSFS